MLQPTRLSRKSENKFYQVQFIELVYQMRCSDHEQVVIFAIRALPLLLNMMSRPLPATAGAAGHIVIVPD